MPIRVALIAFVAFLPALADTLTLRDGRTVQGIYLGGTARQIRMAVGERIESYDVGNVASLQFEGGEAAKPAAAATTPAASKTEPALRPRVLRPEPAVATPATTAVNPNEIPAGTPVVVRMIDSVDTDVNRVGQTFRATVDEAVVLNGRTVIPAGADAVTKLLELKEPGRLSGGGQLTLALESISIGGKKLEVASAQVTQAGKSGTGDSAKVIGGTAALGAIIGAIAGGGRGAAIGAASGAGAGTAIRVLTSGAEVKIPSETRLTFTLQQPVRVP